MNPFNLSSEKRLLRRYSHLKSFLSGDKSEKKPSQIEVPVEEVAEQIDRLNSNKTPVPDNIHLGVLKELKYGIAELLILAL